jgi:hypothetical protein
LWTDRDSGDSDFINITLGSLFDEDLEQLEELGLLQIESDGESDSSNREAEVDRAPHVQGVAHRGAPWFEEMIEHSSLGKLKRQKGGRTSGDGSVQVEWEIIEFTSGEDDELTSSSGKRKIGELEEYDDNKMQT